MQSGVPPRPPQRLTLRHRRLHPLLGRRRGSIWRGGKRWLVLRRQTHPSPHRCRPPNLPSIVRQAADLDEEDLSRRYRDATPFLPNASFSSPSTSLEDFFRGVVLLGQTAASAAVAPVATSSPSASRPRHHGRGGQRQEHQQQQRQQRPPAADNDAQRAPQPQGQRGAAPSRR